MSGTTNFRQWNPDANNQESDGQYLIDEMRTGGAVDGIFETELANKLFFQLAQMVSALAESLATKGYTVLDGSAGTSGADFTALKAVLAQLSTAPEDQNRSFTYVVDTGAADAYVIAPTPAVTAYVEGLFIQFKAANANTGPATLTVNDLSTKSITLADGSALSAGDIAEDAIVFVIYDGSKFQMISTPSSSATDFATKLGVQQASYSYVDDTGAADAYVIAPTPAVTAYVEGLKLQFKAAHANTGACTISVSELAAKSIKMTDGTDPGAGKIQAGGIFEVMYDGVNFQLMSAPVEVDTSTLATKSGVQNESYTYYSDTGSSDAYVITPSPAISAYTTGQKFQFKASTSNTGSCTLNVNSKGAKSIIHSDGSATVTGDILENGIYEVIYNGSKFQLISSIGGSSSASSYNQILPECTSASHKIGVTGSTGSVVISGGYVFIIRGAVVFKTANFLSGDRTFATSASHTYHLRFAYNITDDTGRENMGAAFYTAKGITAQSFYLINVADASYNPDSLDEDSASFDTKLDDMLIAKVVTNAGNSPTITTFRNTNTKMSSSDNLVSNETIVGGSTNIPIIGWDDWKNDFARSINGNFNYNLTISVGGSYTAVSGSLIFGVFLDGDVICRVGVSGTLLEGPSYFPVTINYRTTIKRGQTMNLKYTSYASSGIWDVTLIAQFTPDPASYYLICEI